MSGTVVVMVADNHQPCELVEFIVHHLFFPTLRTNSISQAGPWSFLLHHIFSRLKTTVLMSYNREFARFSIFNNTRTRINRARGGRRPGIQPRPSAVIGTPSGAQQDQAPLSFSFDNPNATNGAQESQGGFVFGQPSNGVSQSFNQQSSTNPLSTSQSFPPFGTNSQNAFNPQLPSSSVFNFSTGPNTINNPFSTSIDSSSGSKSDGMGASSGFQGSIFNIPPTAAFGNSGSNTNGNNPAVKVPGPDPQPFKFGGSGEPANTQSQLGTIMFDSNPKNLFAPKDTSSVLQTNTNIFGQPKSPTKLFGQNPPPSEQTHSQQPISNIFGPQTTEQGSTSSSIFGLNTPSSQQSNAFAIQNEDTMSTSPDNSPQPKDRPNSTPFTFPTAPSQANDGDDSSTQDLGGSLFNRISQPAAEAAKLPATSPVAEQGHPLNDRQNPPPQQQHHTISTTTNQPFFSFPQGPPRQEHRTQEASPTRTGKRMAKPTFGTPPSEEAQAAASIIFHNIEIPSTSPTLQIEVQPTPSASPPTDTLHTSDRTAYKAQGNGSSSVGTTQPILESEARRPATIDFSLCTPPAAPEHCTQLQRRQLAIGWQLKCLDTGLKQHIATCPSFHTESEKVHRFYSMMKEDILSGKNVFPEQVAVSKRKPVDSQHEDENQSKKARIEISPSKSPMQHGQATNGGLFTTNSSAKPLLTEPAPAPVRDVMIPKRKAEDYLVRSNAEEGADGVKKARVEGRVSYPSLSSSPSSHTSSIFKDILNNKEPDPPPGPTGVNSQSADTSTRFPQAGWNSSNLLTAESISGGKATPGALEGGLRNPQNPSGSSSGPTNQVLFGSNPDLTFSQPISSTSGNSVLLPAKQSISDNTPSAMKNSTSLAPPKFDAPVNFLSQFGKSAEATAKKEKASRKAEEFDSDEDDDAEWERKYAEEQRAKKQKLDEELKGRTTKFVPGQGFSLSSEDANKGTPRHSQPSEPASRSSIFSTHKDFSTSVLSKPSQKLVNGHNIFGHLSDAESGAEGSKTGDADDEDTGSEEDDVRGESGEAAKDMGTNESTFQSKSMANNNPFGPFLSPTKEISEKSTKEMDQSQSAGGLFDRISKDANGNPMREIPPPAQKNTDDVIKPMSSQAKTNIFGQGNQASLNNIFGKSSSSALSGSSFGQTSPFNSLSKSLATADASTFEQPSSAVSHLAVLGTSNSPGGDNTWKADSPIKFGNSGSPPGVKITSPSPSKSALGGLFGSPQTKNPTESPTKPASGLFSTTPAKDPSVSFGFGFGGPPKPGIGSLAPPSNLASNNTSRATSPSATTGGESANESNADEETEKHEQLNLTARGPGEEDEDVLFAVKAKAMSYDAANKSWPSKGVGMLRVLKHRETAKTRILMRQDPSGKIVLNAALLGTMKYENMGSKTVKMAVATDQGKLSTWLLRTGKDEDAVELVKILEAEKNN